MQTWADNPYDAPYTQVVQKAGGRRGAPAPAIDVPDLNTKFDEVYQRGGIYHFLSHPQSLDFGPDGFYEKHLSHIGRRADVWYVPMGPAYAFHTIVEKTEVKPMSKGGAKARFAVSNALDRKIYNGSLTLEFAAPASVTVTSNGKKLPERAAGVTDRWNEEFVRREGERLFVTVHVQHHAGVPMRTKGELSRGAGPSSWRASAAAARAGQDVAGALDHDLHHARRGEA